MIKKYKGKPESPSNHVKRVAKFTQRISKEQRRDVLAKLYPSNPRKEA